MTGTLSLHIIEDGLAELLEAREATLQEIGQAPESALPELREQLAVLDKTLEEYLTLEARKVDNYCRFLASAKLLISGMTEEERRIKDRRKRIERAVEWLKRRTVDVMAFAGKKRVDGTNGRYLLRKGNGGLAPLVIDGWDAEAERWTSPETCVVPLDCLTATVVVRGDIWNIWQRLLSQPTWAGIEMSAAEFKVSYAPNQAAIRAKLAAGEAVPGCRLAERGEHLEAK